MIWNPTCKTMKKAATLLSALGLAAAMLPAAHAQFYITEVDAAGSGNTNYGADWFELTYTGSVSSNISGWKMDDGTAAFASAVAFRGITNILPGQTIILLEGNATAPRMRQSMPTSSPFGLAAACRPG